MLMVKGTDMHVNRLNLEKGEVDLAGNIDNISYSDIIREQKPEKICCQNCFGRRRKMSGIGTEIRVFCYAILTGV